MSDTVQKHVLVVDDEDDIRAYLAMALEDAGFQVTEAVDGMDGMEKAKANPPDLISLDLVMPKHSGAKMYRELQKDSTLKKIPVLIVSGHTRDDMGKPDFEELTMSGVGVYLEKPVTPDKYVKTVSDMLGVEAPVAEEEDEDLRAKLESELKDASPEELKRALEALKKK
jgi:DNA-binding response OmpR family regulator